MYKLKGKSSGFHLYLLEFFKNNSIDEKSTFEQIRCIANGNWNSLSKDNREKYKKDCNLIGIDVIEQKLQEIDNKFKEVQALENEKRAEASRKVKYFLEDTFDLFDWNSQVFIFAHVNYQVKVKNDFYPIELGMVKYSIDEGVMDSLHIHINSSPLPIGNENLARVMSEDTHQLPVNTNFGKSFNEANVELTKFLDNEKPYIFTLNEKDGIAAVQYTLDKIIDTKAHVIPLENLLIRSYEALYKKNFNDDANDILINKNPWESYDIGCEFHKELAASKYCSLAKAKRWAYHISKILLPSELLYPVKHTIY
ncbi:protein maelstrom homolog isoform X2 [Chironomus tepperi]|uniref:protein maelstrom homolog isoform X2 n=1 Tax=Chironomus tepperi TaxID=113505 RepID=UPI00391EF855